jgi:hypothetical protein
MGSEGPSLGVRFIIDRSISAEGKRLKIRSEILSAVFGIYFITVASGAILVASGTTYPWYDGSTSTMSYGIFMVAYVLILSAVVAFSAIVSPTRPGTNVSLSVLIGPVVVAAIYLGIAGICFPAAGGWLQTSFQLNTAVLLAMSYSWFGLAFFFALAVGNVLQQRAEALGWPAKAGRGWEMAKGGSR